jgi:beta-galactosidase
MIHRSLLTLLFAISALHAEREVQPLTKDWKFIRQDVDQYADTKKWETVTIPHTWNALDGQAGPAEISSKQETPEQAAAATEVWMAEIEAKKATDPHLAKKGLYEGACWYARNLEIPEDWEGKRRVFIRFQAACLVARVYLNDTFIGEHRGGFTAFCFELTDYLKFGNKNELRVQVDNSRREDVPPLFGDFNLYGGIYRPVDLIVTDEICVSPLDYASPGVYLTTKSLNDSQAVVEVRTLVSNGQKPVLASKSEDQTPGAETTKTTKGKKDYIRPPPVRITLSTQIQDKSVQIVAQDSKENDVPSEEVVPFIQTLKIKDPHRWNGRLDPYLYRVVVTVQREGSAVDQVIQPLGLRDFAIKEGKGFFLNGKPYPVLGVNRHQDIRNKGWALSAQEEENDAKLIQEMGANAIRNAHYPQSQNWHDIHDRQGTLLWDEIPLVNVTRNTRAFWQNTEEMLREMVSQLYNHPSSIWWGLFNELGTRPMPPSDEQLKHLQSVAKELDPQRFVVAASCKYNQSFNLVTEQMAFNHYPAWYHDSAPSEMKNFVEKRSKSVKKPIAVSEYGAGGNIAHHTEGAPVRPEPRGSFHPEEYQAYVHEGDWAAMKDDPLIWGTFIWNMFDFACRGRKEGNVPSLNDKGLITHDRKIKKDAFYFYKANWNPEPMVYLTSHRATARKEPTTEIKAYSNCAEVELFVNSTSLGKAQPDRFKICRWEKVQLSPGKNSIRAVAQSGKTMLEDSCEWRLGNTKP